MRIACLIPFYSLFSLLSICFPKADVYISPWLDVVQAFALGSFFLLMCEFVSEDTQERDSFFNALEIKDKKGRKPSGGSLFWYRVSDHSSAMGPDSHICTQRQWFMIFQYPIVAILSSILTDITQAAGVYCTYVSKPYFARLWVRSNKGSVIFPS